MFGQAVVSLLSRSAAVGRFRRNLITYHVFLNFRGEDVRCGFADYLYTSLKVHEVRVFKDDEDLLGEKIGEGLFQAIDNSRIAIVVISNNYGESKWCLNELHQILRCRAEQGQVVLPVFYDVEVSDVHDQTGEFGKAFRELAKHHTPGQVEKWKGALRSVARIKGWSLRENAGGRQGKLAKMVVNRVLTILNKGTSVFPIFGPDTRKTLASQLRKSLKEGNISVFNDDDPELIGEDLEDVTRRAMEKCEIFIPILSKDFISSRDCLNSLAQMSRCINENGSKILPIFYNIGPSQKQELWDHFQQYTSKNRVPEIICRPWQESLELVLDTSGLVSENIGNGDEVRLIKKAVNNVRKLLGNNLNA